MPRERKVEWESYHIDDFSKNEKDELLDDVDRDSLAEEEQEAYDRIDSLPVVVETPMGLMMKDDSMNLLRRIEHRVCHTNFTISEREATMVNFIEGVETLTVISRYQMIIGFGRLFDGSEIRGEITHKLINMDEYTSDMFIRDKKILDRFA